MFPVVLVDAIPQSFSRGLGVAARGDPARNVPDVFVSFSEQTLYVTDFLYHYTEIPELSWPASLVTKLKALSGTRLSDWTESAWAGLSEPLDTQLAIAPPRGRQRLMQITSDTDVRVSMKNLPIGTVVEYSDSSENDMMRTTTIISTRRDKDGLDFTILTFHLL